MHLGYSLLKCPDRMEARTLVTLSAQPMGISNTKTWAHAPSIGGQLPCVYPPPCLPSPMRTTMPSCLIPTPISVGVALLLVGTIVVLVLLYLSSNGLEFVTGRFGLCALVMPRHAGMAVKQCIPWSDRVSTQTSPTRPSRARQGCRGSDPQRGLRLGFGRGSTPAHRNLCMTHISRRGPKLLVELMTSDRM